MFGYRIEECIVGHELVLIPVIYYLVLTSWNGSVLAISPTVLLMLTVSIEQPSSCSSRLKSSTFCL